MSGKRNLSKLNAQKVAEKLAIGPLHKQVLLAKGTQVNQESSQWVQIADDEFRLMSEWYYIACLNLAKLPQAKSDPAWIARRLNITVD